MPLINIQIPSTVNMYTYAVLGQAQLKKFATFPILHALYD